MGQEPQRASQVVAIGQEDMQGGPALGLGVGLAGRCSFLHVIQRFREGWGPRAKSQGPLSGGSTLQAPGAVAQDLAELLEAPLHLRDARQLLLQPLLLLSQAQAGG